MGDEAAHISVMPKEVMDLLQLPEGGTAFDGTLGLGGHSKLMAERLGPNGHLIAVDRDATSLKIAQKNLSSLPLKVSLTQASFRDIRAVLDSFKVGSVNGILLDLGISSFQLDNPSRGFAFRTEGPLDMRMDQNTGESAADFLNTAKEEAIAKVIFELGEERFSRRIASAIINARSQEQITDTKQLADLILRALPKGYQRGRLHPATRTFQALRIYVNRELDVLTESLDECFKCLSVGGRLCVISFHSLEDRIVKNKFKALAEEGKGLILTKKPLEPSEEESKTNSRARSAKLRAITRIS